MPIYRQNDVGESSDFSRLHCLHWVYIAIGVHHRLGESTFVSLTTSFYSQRIHFSITGASETNKTHIWSTFALLLMIVLAVGCTDGSHAGSNATTVSDSGSELDDQAVNSTFAKSMEEFERKLASWKAAVKAKSIAESELEDLKSQELVSPVFQERVWVTMDEVYQTEAVVVTVDSKSVTLKKNNGKIVSVARERLDENGRQFAAKAFDDLLQFKKELCDQEPRFFRAQQILCPTGPMSPSHSRLRIERDH